MLAKEKKSDLDQFPPIIILKLNISCMNLAFANRGHLINC